MTAMQDWLNIRPPFDPRNHVMAFIRALRGVSPQDATDSIAEPVFLRPGVERC